MKLNKSLLFYLAINFLVNFNSMGQSGYIGEDNRKEVSELTDILKTRSQSVVTVVRRHENNHVSGGGYKFNTENANPLDLKICEDQRFANQNRHSEVVCGGVLISSDLILTAASCINENSDCTSDYSFIFGYTEGQSEFNPRDVYHCQEVIWKKNENGIQAAIIKLDRPVNARIPLPINLETPLAEEQSILLIGPHAKLPLKYSTGHIKYISSEANTKLHAIGTDLDCYVDDYGSAILNTEGQLIGVLNSSLNLAANISTENIPDNASEIKPNLEDQAKQDAILSTTTKDLSTTKTNDCIGWDSPQDVQDRSQFQPTLDAKNTQSAFIPKGCSFTPIGAFIEDISVYLPNQIKFVRAPTIALKPEPNLEPDQDSGSESKKKFEQD